MFTVKTDLIQVKALLLTGWIDYLISLSLGFFISKNKENNSTFPRVDVSILRKICVKHLAQLKNTMYIAILF